MPRAGVPPLAILLLASLAFAQAPACRLRGRILDETGIPVAHATLAWRSAAGETYRAASDLAGRFVSPPLPPGAYQLTVEKPGFFRLETAVTVAAAAPPLAYKLVHERELHQQVSVFSAANPVEPAENTRHETLLAQQIRDIPAPTSHDLRSYLPMLPGVVADSQHRLHVAGGRESDTEYTLDGFDISDPIDGSLSAGLNVDAVRAADLEPDRAGAQFAHAAAGALALRTEMGDDSWRFDTTNFIPAPELYQGVHFANWYPRFLLSGPIRRGHAWFSDALGIQHTLGLVKELPRGANISHDWAADNLLRAQWDATPRQVLEASFLYNYDNEAHAGLGAFTPLSTTTNFGARRYFFSARDQISVASSLLQLGGAAEFEHDAFSPLGNDLYVLHPVGASGNYFMSQRRAAHRWQFVGSWLVPQRHWLGTHDFQLGFNADWLRFSRFAARNPFEIVRGDGSLIQRTTFAGAFNHAFGDRRGGWYAEDSWQLNRWLRVVPALRFDHSALLGSGVAEPRLAAAILPWSDDRAKLTLGIGRYSEPPDFSLYARGFDQRRSDVFFNAASQPLGPPVPTSFFVPPVNFAMPRFNLASAAWEQRLARGTFVGLHYLRRQEHDGLAFDLGPQPVIPGLLPNVFLLGNGRQDRYQSWEISLRHAFSARASVFADYTRSHATSNQVIDHTLEAPVFVGQAPGALPWDAPNRFVSWGWAPVPIWGSILLSYRFEARSGFPFSLIDDQHQIVGPPDGTRFPQFRELDLGIERVFPFRHHLWALRLAVINVADRQNPNVVVNNIDAPNFLAFEGGQGRAFTGRIRLVGRH